MLKKKLQKTVKIESRNVVETDTTSLCLLKKPTYRQHFRGRRSFNYAKRFSVFNQEIWKWNPHSSRPLWALRPPFYLASSLHPPHEPSPQLLIGWRPKNLSLKSMKKLWDLFSNRIENNCGICFDRRRSKIFIWNDLREDTPHRNQRIPSWSRRGNPRSRENTRSRKDRGKEIGRPCGPPLSRSVD